MDKSKSKRRIYVIGGLTLLFFTTISLWSEVLSLGSFQITFFDVGQGDAASIRTPSGKQIIIDGGPDSAILGKLAKEIPFWDRTIDMIILSHPAKDHMAGLLDVLQKYSVKTVLWTGIEKDTEIFREWERALLKEQEEGARIVLASGRQSISIGKGFCPQRMDILSPVENVAGTLVKGDDNDTSLVVRLYDCTYSALFTGDLTKKGEGILLKQNILIDSDILKVGHHGSKTSSSEEFIKAVSPDVAVISLGQGNQYGHPHKETLATLEKYGIDIRRTDEEGDISFRFK